MDVSFILAAAEHAAEEHHKSELPFFLAGGVLASFAVVISVIGFKRPDFPTNETAARGVMALSATLVAAAMFAIVYVSA
jgi:hypothetical protein